MHTSQVIYYNNKPLVLTSESAKQLEQKHAFSILLSGSSSDRFREAFEHLGQPTSTGVVIIDLSFDALWKQLFELCTPIKAAGGVVVNEQKDILFIHRRGKWDLPKGKCDDGEDIADCAVREVTEETGLKQVTLHGKICDTYHIYTESNRHLLKCTAWYRMEGNLSDPLTPQAEEGITEAKWVPAPQLHTVAANTYEAIREVLKKAGYRW